MSNIVPYDFGAMPSRRELQRRIDNLAIPAEHKLALSRIGDVTAQMGDRAVEIGRQILAFAFELLRHFPSLTLAVVLALIVNALLVSVPLLGPLLQPLFGPLVLAAGITLGGLSELYEGEMKIRVDSLVAEFQRIFG